MRDLGFHAYGDHLLAASVAVVVATQHGGAGRPVFVCRGQNLAVDTEGAEQRILSPLIGVALITLPVPWQGSRCYQLVWLAASRRRARQLAEVSGAVLTAAAAQPFRFMP
jgi:hypothetical protein